MTCDRRLPNMRVQRTRSSPSAPHSPLTRRPLGAAIIILALAAAGGCRHTVVDYSFQVEGEVADGGGTPLSDVRVTLQINGVAYQAITTVSRTDTYTDGHGRFGFHYLTHESGQTYSLWFDKQGYESQSVEGAS
jgi:hypothetical protein